MTTDTGDLRPGREPAPPPPRCGAQTELTDEEIAGIVRWTVSAGWERPFYCLDTTAACRLSPGHPHQHGALQAVTRDTETRPVKLAWLRWDTSSREIQWHDLHECAEWPASPDDDAPTCTLFAGHPGQHNVT